MRKIKWLSLLLIIGLLLGGVMGCGQSQESATPGAGTESTGTADKEERLVTLGIIQYVAHPSLDAAREGFLDVLKENGYEEGSNLRVVHKDAQADMSIAQTIAQQFAQDEPDLILAIATPTAQAMANATKDIPILITAVTDPVSASLVESMDKPGGNVTGTSDYVSIAAQLELLQQIVPEVKNIGLIYNSGEQNSIVQADEVKKYAAEKGLNVVEATPTNSSEVLQAAQSLVGKVDAIYVPTDNTVVSALEAVVKVSYDNQIPMFPGEGDSVVRGGIATAGVNYYRLGRQTGEQALKILAGVNPAEIPVETQTEMSVIVNLKAAETVGIEIPQSVIDQAIEIIEE
ncbi:MAG: ABC transporter substrate-binding protein [Clostridia bacterium]|nr:ABC transporter substrate-binding protein [Clostridia bacterium]